MCESLARKLRDSRFDVVVGNFSRRRTRACTLCAKATTAATKGVMTRVIDVHMHHCQRPLSRTARPPCCVEQHIFTPPNHPLIVIHSATDAHRAHEIKYSIKNFSNKQTNWAKARARRARKRTVYAIFIRRSQAETQNEGRLCVTYAPCDKELIEAGTRCILCVPNLYAMLGRKTYLNLIYTHKHTRTHADGLQLYAAKPFS